MRWVIALLIFVTSTLSLASTGGGFSGPITGPFEPYLAGWSVQTDKSVSKPLVELITTALVEVDSLRPPVINPLGGLFAMSRKPELKIEVGELDFSVDIKHQENKDYVGEFSTSVVLEIPKNIKSMPREEALVRLGKIFSTQIPNYIDFSWGMNYVAKDWAERTGQKLPQETKDAVDFSEKIYQRKGAGGLSQGFCLNFLNSILKN